MPPDFGRAGVGVVTGPTCSACASPTQTSRNRTAAPPLIDTDLVGEHKEQGHDYPAGPIASLGPGTSRIRVW